MKKLLIANRGEIAMRLVRAARDVGLETVAVYAADDAACPHHTLADGAVALAGCGAAAYLDMDALLHVARAHGVTPRGFNGFDPDAFGAGRAGDAAAASVAAMVAFNRPNAKTHSGIWRDIAVRKRRTEVDAQLVPILALAQGLGLACPTLQKLVDLIHSIERGEQPQDDANLLALLPESLPS